MKITRAEIIAVGTELLLGQIANTNAQWLSAELANIGVDTYYHTVLGDNQNRLVTTFKQAQARSNTIIVTGGLGPTDDDLSREAFAEMTGLAIIEEPIAMQKITDYYKAQGTEMTPNNRRQARKFTGSEALANTVGMAPGIHITYKDVDWYFLPGVPREMKQITQDHIIPRLQTGSGDQVITSHVLKFIGIGESKLEHELKDIIQNQTNPTIAPLAQQDAVTIRLTAKAANPFLGKKLLAATEEVIMERVGDYCFGVNGDTIEAVVAAALEKRGKRLAAAESLTGGLFSSKIVSVPGSSAYFKGSVVCYDISVKENVLHIPSELLEREGTVSQACAEAMAQNVAMLLDSSIGISFTGIAGPESIEGKPVGTVYISIYDTAGKIKTTKHLFQGDRDQIRHRAVLKGYELLYQYVKDQN